MDIKQSLIRAVFILIGFFILSALLGFISIPFFAQIIVNTDLELIIGYLLSITVVVLLADFVQDKLKF